MKIQNYQEIQLGSDMFADIRERFDSLLQKLFKKMEDNNSDEGVIDLKLNISIQSEWIPDQAEPGGTHQVNMPVIKHKISTQVPVKDALDGSKETGMALVYDEELKRYVLKYVQFDGQMNIYDMDFGDQKEGPEDQKQLEEMPIPMIEDKAGSDAEAADGGTETPDGDNGGFIDIPDEDGAQDTTAVQDDDYYYDDPGYDEPC